MVSASASSRVGFVLAAMLAALAFASPAAAKDETWVVDVPLLQCDGMPCVDATLGNGATGRYAIDTGDRVTVVDDADAQAIGFGPDNFKDGHIASAAHPNLSIGGVTLDAAPAIAVPIKGEIDKGDFPHVRGSLAYTAFRDRIVQIDFTHQRFRVSAPLTAPHPCEGACAPFDLITFGQKGPPIVVAQGFSVNGKPVRAQIDTLYTGAMLIYSASMAPLGFTVPDTAPTETFPFTDGGVKMRLGAKAAVDFAGLLLSKDMPVYFPTPGVHEPDALFEATAGLGVFGHAVLTLNFHDKTLSVG